MDKPLVLKSPQRDEAITAERRIKGWSRAKKAAYMRGDFPTLVELVKRATRSDKKA